MAVWYEGNLNNAENRREENGAPGIFCVGRGNDQGNGNRLFQLGNQHLDIRQIGSLKIQQNPGAVQTLCAAFQLPGDLLRVMAVHRRAVIQNQQGSGGQSLRQIGKPDTGGGEMTGKPPCPPGKNRSTPDFSCRHGKIRFHGHGQNSLPVI